MQLVKIPNFLITYHNQTLDLSKPHIMGILNVTPDSFSDGGKHNTLDAALYHAERMIAEGARIIDVGGESTRPNASVVSENEELDRVVAVVEKIRQNSDDDVWISVDTSSPKVIKACCDVGAGIWNDVRALVRPQALKMASELQIPVILMHNRGEPTTMNDLANYEDVLNDVCQELQKRIDSVVAGGVKRENLILDVGFGFAKNYQQNIAWLHKFYRLHKFGLPVMVALSRKRFIGEMLKNANLEHDINHRDMASAVAGLVAVQQGACIVRTHDVKMMKQALAVWQTVN
ncbi:dihydropteroate synthase [Moraxella macacae 0408225]|uniref:Dihydropteroate synthase n=1 Tax=Moraxella macacae 0408225 TaxID=1230338 RepID=L2F9B3_9GAMM|nr:dihydropteroate synthase [Moraxella macacae]ELA09649.1 dihydropteroate synthase [Moraxella macacae 0408225]